MVWITIVFTYVLLQGLNGVLSQQSAEKQKTPEQELAEAIAKYLSTTKGNPEN